MMMWIGMSCIRSELCGVDCGELQKVWFMW